MKLSLRTGKLKKKKHSCKLCKGHKMGMANYLKPRERALKDVHVREVIEALSTKSE